VSIAFPVNRIKSLGRRWLKFNAVGGIGVAVQLGALVVYKSLFGIHYLAATALAVETAVLHNFFWHQQWTWADRARSRMRPRLLFRRLFRFHLSNGLVSILSNVVLMRLLAGHFRLHYLLANVISIAITSAANFLLSELFVFRPAEE
jgi:putative flippase GtrA